MKPCCSRGLRLFACLVLGLFATLVFAAVRPAALFQDGVVLQRDLPLPVWGMADPGEAVTVRFAGLTASAVAGSDGRWLVRLAPLGASAEPSVMEISGSDTVTVSNVVVGEVWLASGQSNMEWSLGGTHDGDLECLTARFPLIREFKVKHAIADAPAADVSGTWVAASPETVGSFSAVAYYFARELHLALDGVPVGILLSAWGGTPIESWMSAETLASDPAFARVQERWRKAVEEYPERKAKFEADLAAWKANKAAARERGERFATPRPREPDGPGSPRAPSVLYNGMIAPLVPAAFRGVIWYQGESNVGRAQEYQALFPAMIRAWRVAFGGRDFPFFWAQLAAFSWGDNQGLGWPALREAQTRTMAVPATGQAVTLDAGVSDASDIHPRAKLPVGRRLSRLALARVYGFEQLVDSGPQFAGVEAVPAPADESGPAALRVRFAPEGRRVRHPAAVLRGFEVAGEDRVFHPADAYIVDGQVVVSSPAVAVPVAVRYAWRNVPEAWLQDDLGLPVPPFRSDDW